MSRETRTGWRQMDERAASAIRLLVPNCVVYDKPVEDGVLRVIVGPEEAGFHLSISHTGHDGHPSRYPTWDEIVEARYGFMPSTMMVAMFLPPRDQYINLHETTFHLWSVS